MNENAFEIVIRNMAAILSRPQCVNQSGARAQIYKVNSINATATDDLPGS